MTNTTAQIITRLVTEFGLTVEQANQTVTLLELGCEVEDEVYEILFNHYCNTGEIPYGTATAKDGDPIDWVNVRIAEELGLGF